MIKTFLSRLLLLFVLTLCSFSGSAWALRPYSSPYSDAAQDATGRVWTLGYGGQQGTPSDGILSCWLSAGWTPQNVPASAGFRAVALTRGDDGFVYALWQKTDPGPDRMQSYLVTVHYGVSSRVLAHFSVPMNISAFDLESAPAIFAGAKGDVWAEGSQPILWHITPDGSVQKFPLSTAQYYGEKFPHEMYPPVISSWADGAGRRWFWQDAAQNPWHSNGLRGVLIWDGKTLDYHSTLPGIPDQIFSSVSPLDANHLWIAVGNAYIPIKYSHGTLYRVDTQTLAATVEVPQQGPFHCVMQVFPAGGDWYAVDQQQQNTVLWREHAGKWQHCLESPAAFGTFRMPGVLYPWIDEPTGLWLGGTGGVWWLPRGGRSALWVDWRRGVPSLPVNGLYPLPDSHLLAAGYQGAAEIPAILQPVRPPPPALIVDGMGAPAGLAPVIADQRHHLWGVCNSGSTSTALAEWNGKRWHLFVPPKEIASISGLYACDTLGRLWLSTYTLQLPAEPQPVYGYALYDPRHDTWTNYKTEQDALQSAAVIPAMAFLPNHTNEDPPMFSGDGRVVYSHSKTIFFYDYKSWRVWQTDDLLPGYESYTYSNLHFNAQGNLELTLDVQVCEWTPDGGWRRTQTAKPAANTDLVPPGGPNGLSAVPVVDNIGRKWFTHDGVYTTANGLWVKQEELSEPTSPFRYRYEIADVLPDPAGRIFFVTYSSGGNDLFVWSPPLVPKPALSAISLSDNAITIQVQEKLAGAHWFLWRLGSGKWSKPQAMNANLCSVTLTMLPAGNYRMEAQVLDRHLQPSPLSVTVFSIRAASNAQIAHWVQTLLSGTDDAREAAAAGLLRQSDAALPALQAARPHASEAGGWWIDAVLQQIMDAKQRSEGTGN